MKLAQFVVRQVVAVWLLVEVYRGSRIALIVMLTLFNLAHEAASFLLTKK